MVIVDENGHEAPGYKCSVHKEFQSNLSTHSVDLQCAYN